MKGFNVADFQHVNWDKLDSFQLNQLKPRFNSWAEADQTLVVNFNKALDEKFGSYAGWTYDWNLDIEGWNYCWLENESDEVKMALVRAVARTIHQSKRDLLH